jgi:hypothetical protein
LDQTQYAIERGLAAKYLLESESFNLVLRELAGSLEQELLTSEPFETKKRESAYFQHKGLQNVISTLAVWVTLGEEAQAEVDNSKDNDTE